MNTPKPSIDYLNELRSDKNIKEESYHYYMLTLSWDPMVYQNLNIQLNALYELEEIMYYNIGTANQRIYSCFYSSDKKYIRVVGQLTMTQQILSLQRISPSFTKNLRQDLRWEVPFTYQSSTSRASYNALFDIVNTDTQPGYGKMSSDVPGLWIGPGVWSPAKMQEWYDLQNYADSASSVARFNNEYNITANLNFDNVPVHMQQSYYNIAQRPSTWPNKDCKYYPAGWIRQGDHLTCKKPNLHDEKSYTRPRYSAILNKSTRIIPLDNNQHHNYSSTYEQYANFYHKHKKTKELLTYKRCFGNLLPVNTNEYSEECDNDQLSMYYSTNPSIIE